MSEAIKPGENDILLVVDIQNDFCPDGALAVPEGDAVVPLINRLMDRFSHVVLTQDWHTPGHSSFASAHPGKSPYETVEASYGPQILWPDHCVQGTEGAQFRWDLDVTRAELIVRKLGAPGVRIGVQHLHRQLAAFDLVEDPVDDSSASLSERP